jgi:hypothetical protein
LSVLRIGRTVPLGALWVLGLLVLSGGVLGDAHASASGRALLSGSGSDGCSGASVPSEYTGAVSILGGPLPVSARAGVSLSYTFDAEVELSDRENGTVVSASCEPEEGTTVSQSNGSFSFDLTLPATQCYGAVCSHAYGPYGPVGASPAGAPPAGYRAVEQANGTTLSVDLVAQLAGLRLAPDVGNVTLSADAPAVLAAVPLTAGGAPSPLAPAFAWNLTGAGWTFVGSSSGPNVTVEATPGAGPGWLAVSATAVVGPNRFSAGPVGVGLASVATAFDGGGANRTFLDAGSGVAFTVEGTGASAYTYTAEANPGLGLPVAEWPCTTTPSGNGAASIACRGAVVYPAAGTAYPSVALTNSYSTAGGSLPTVTVAPVPALTVAPGTPTGYAGTPIPVRLAVAPGSGTPPYTLACLAAGTTGPVCSTSPGPNWTFDPAFSSAGTYPALLWVLDSDGTNRSTRVSFDVVASPTVSPITVLSPLAADSAGTFSCEVAGGDLPARYWWNVSNAVAPLATGVLASDGTLSTTWVPAAAGTVDVSFAMADALGTVAERSALVTVAPPVARALAEVEVPGAGSVVAGTPVGIAWQAEDVTGAPVPGYSSVGSVELDPGSGLAAGSAWVNATGVGPLAPDGPGSFAVPAAAWDLGRLAVTVTTTHAGPQSVVLDGPGLLGATGALEFDVAPDLAHLHLFDPNVEVAGTRVNRTFWLVADELGNPTAGAALDLRYTSDGTSSEAVLPVVPAGTGGSGLWVNVTAPSTAAGSWELVDPTGGAVLFGPVAVPAAPSGASPLTPPVLTLVTAAPAGAVGLGLTAWVQRRRRADARAGAADEAELRSLVEGRDRVIALLRDARALDLAGLEAAWGTAPPPPKLADWVASLVADGTVGARSGPDGVARFCLAASPSGPPVVLVDPGALERAAAARRALDEERDPSARPPPD